MQTLSSPLALLFLVTQTPDQPIGEGKEGGTIQEPEATEAQDAAAILMAARAVDCDASDAERRGSRKCHCRVSCYIFERP
ncbi:defensin-A1-like [Tachyglossus aculeatus]|uniref:defensin-A1-like n=1 Tax=Tachyglossus aculeatus TaxID=9261 RepID=UPI0018F3F7C4|nr:defensin-A1-like [Tachyglossus aculeatus]